MAVLDDDYLLQSCRCTRPRGQSSPSLPYMPGGSAKSSGCSHRMMMVTGMSQLGCMALGAQ